MAALVSAGLPVSTAAVSPLTKPAGVKVSAQIYGVQVPAQADIVITDSHPMDSDLRQGVKALGNTVRAVKRGGVSFAGVVVMVEESASAGPKIRTWKDRKR